MGDVKMTVNVSLCGSIPRSQMICRGVRPQNKTLTKCPNLSFVSNGSEWKAGCNASLKAASPMRKHRKVSSDITFTLPSQIVPPKWAVPARGEARLEPVCGGLFGHSPVDLSTRSCFLFGRSQTSDVQLIHDTSSRRHAIVFHHPNGSCYVIDCGSAHGTYVNGIRVKTAVVQIPDDQDSQCTGSVVPHRVKKGALIRFGGIGAPTYILKSFSVGLATLVKDLEIAEVFTCTSNIIEDEPVLSAQRSLSSYNRSENITNDALLTVNTRLNAMGRTSMQNASRNCLPALARARLGSQRTLNSFTQPFLKKRTLSSLLPRTVSSEDDYAYKKRRTPLFENMQHLPFSIGNSITDAALISPSRSKQSFTIDLNDSDRPVVSPNPLHNNDELEIDSSVKSILMVPLTLSIAPREKKRVKFSISPHDEFIAPIRTPDNLQNFS